MFLEIPDLLTPQEIGELRSIAASAIFADGRITNPHSKVKRNEFIQDRDAFTRSSAILVAALRRHQDFNNFAFPRMMANPMLTKYGTGMHYGLHADAAFMPVGDRPMRSDLSCTIWIGDPDDYDGGELVVHLGTRRLALKGSAGSATVYPSNMLHEVMPVTRGERLVGLTFIESRIANPEQRELLYELNEVAALEGLNMDFANFTRLQRVQMGLLRLWGSA